MSCDYSVWHTPAPLSSEEAVKLFIQLCEGNISGVSAHPGIEAFYAELTGLHPEIDDVPEDQADDTDLCPWSLAFDRSEGYISMSCVWSKAEYVGELIERLAAKHGLTFYDPQSERVVNPDEGRAASGKRWWKLW